MPDSCEGMRLDCRNNKFIFRTVMVKVIIIFIYVFLYLLNTRTSSAYVRATSVLAILLLSAVVRMFLMLDYNLLGYSKLTVMKSGFERSIWDRVTVSLITPHSFF